MKKIVYLSVAGIMTLSSSSSVLAVAGGDLDMYAQNNILFYECSTSITTASVGTWDGESAAGLSDNQTEFVVKYHDIAEKLSIQYGIPWETVMAQGLLESAAGTSNFAVNRNNFFGIGAFDSNPDNAYSYDTPEEGWKGYYENIRKTSVYRDNGVFQGDAITDPYVYLQAIKNAGYATDPAYVESNSKLIAAIEELSKTKGWKSSAELAEAYPEMLTNAAANAQGAGTEVELASTTSAQTDECCDPSSSSTVSSNVTWDSGWISGGIDGYVKDDALDGRFNVIEDATEYTTTSPNDSSTPGPNKILLHDTQGTAPSGDTALSVYGSVTKSAGTDEGGKTYSGGESGITPAHFTIDIKNKKLYQHFSIDRPASAIKAHDASAGIQIEIIGYDDSPDVTESQKASEWYLPSDENFSESDWQYLGTLLNAISAETGIPLTSSVSWEYGVDRLSADEFKDYSGILGHMHAADNDHTDPVGIWDKVETALGDVSVCEGGATGNVAALQETVSELAWPLGDPMWSHTQKTPTDAMSEALTHDYYHGGGATDCGGFVHAAMQESGWDTNFNFGYTGSMIVKLASGNGWSEVSSVSSVDDLQPGDVAVNSHHTWLYTGVISGFNEEGFASASLGGHVPIADGNGFYATGEYDGTKWFRKD